MREFDPLRGVFPDPNLVMCKDCKYRDKTEVELNGKTIKPGITRDFCKMYRDGKPREVLFLNANCRYYRKDDS